MAKKAGKAKAKKKTLKSFKQLGRALKTKKPKPEGVGDMIKREIAKKQPQATRHIKEIKVGKRHRKDLGDLTSLARSIDERGALLHPIVITPNNTLIAGERRLKAWQMCELSRHGTLPIPVHIVDIDAIVAGERDENAERKDFTPSEMVAIVEALAPLEKKKAKERQAHGATAPGKPGATLFGTPSKPDPEKGRAIEKASAATGRSYKTVEKASAVVGAARKDPGKYGKLVEDMDRTGRVDGPFKRLQNMQASEKIRNEPSPLPGNGPYRAGIIDFPWPGDPDEPERTEGRGYYPYPTMTLEQMEAMAGEVAKILHDDCCVGIWIPNFHLARGDQVGIIKAMGLDAKTIRTWNKPTFGNGQLMRGQTEQLIYATRGKPQVDGSSISTRLDAPRPPGDDHSAKPAQSYIDFERQVPAPRYFELFARRPMPPNWDGHGNQVGTLVDTGKAPKAEIDPTKPLKVKTLLEALEAIEAGRAIEAKGVRLVDEISRCISGGLKKPKLTKDGKEKLAELRRDREDDEKVAALPKALRDLEQLYLQALPQLNDAIVAGDKDKALAVGLELWFIARAANDGENSDRGEGGSRLRDVSAAPIGMVPTWGQRGTFTLEVDGLPYIVSIGSWIDRLGDLDVYPADPTREYPEDLDAWSSIDGPEFEPRERVFGNTDYGWHDLDPRELLCRTVAQYCAERIRAEASQNVRRGKPVPMAFPDEVYRMPAAGGDDWPVRLTKAELDAVRPTASMAKRKLTHADLHKALEHIEACHGGATNTFADVRKELEEQGLVRVTQKTIKLVKAGQDRLERYRAIAKAAEVPASEQYQRDLAAAQAKWKELRDTRTSWPAGHVVSMTRDGDNNSVATCECGNFVARVPRDGTDPLQRIRREIEMEVQVEAHWAQVEAAPNPPRQEGMRDPITAPPDAPIAEDVAELRNGEDDDLSIPAFLKVENRGKAAA